MHRQGLVIAASATAPTDTRGVVVTDSRRLRPGDIFIAYRGVRGDAHDFLPAALANQPGLLIIEDQSKLPDTKTPWLAVKSGRAAWTYLAAAAHGNPQDKLTMLGVTGTNGKTSTVWMTAELLRAAGIPCATIGTLGATYGDAKMTPTSHTTPDPDSLYAILADIVRHGTRVVAMEVSSHAIAYEKLLPIRYGATAFTSFTRDHLDFHPTMEHYLDTKWRLFTELARPRTLMAYATGLPDLPWHAVQGRPVSYGDGGEAQLNVLSTSLHGSVVQLETPLGAAQGTVPYFATHALENFTASWLLASEVAGRALPAELWATMRAVPGRLERVEGKGPTVIVDYAHTPDALEKTLQVLRPLCQGQLIAVFGCGGDRDPGKRPIMGEIAGRLADRVIVTSDNPRTEPPQAIVDAILTGVRTNAPVKGVVDREAAIAGAIRDAKDQDTILIAGKGHEDYQLIDGKTLPFDDRLVARRYLR